MGGQALPFQIMYAGKTSGSLPEINNPKSESKDANDEAKRLKFHFEWTGIPGNHWSNLETMKSYVNNVLSVYFNERWVVLGRKNQVCICTIDCWSVHSLAEIP